MFQVKENIIYSLHFLHWNHSELRYKSIAIQLFMVLVALNLWNIRDSIVLLLIEMVLVHFFLIIQVLFFSKAFDVYLPHVARLTFQFLLPAPVLHNSLPPDLSFSSSEFGLNSFHAPRKEVKNTLLPIPQPGFTAALSKIYSFTLGELLFEPTLDLFPKQKLLQLPKFLSESNNTQHSAPTQFIRNWRTLVCKMHLFSPSVLFTFKGMLQPQRQVFV